MPRLYTSRVPSRKSGMFITDLWLALHSSFCLPIILRVLKALLSFVASSSVGDFFFFSPLIVGLLPSILTLEIFKCFEEEVACKEGFISLQFFFFLQCQPPNALPTLLILNFVFPLPSLLILSNFWAPTFCFHSPSCTVYKLVNALRGKAVEKVGFTSMCFSSPDLISLNSGHFGCSLFHSYTFCILLSFYSCSQWEN